MCRSGCLTQDHASYGECCRAAAPRVAFGATAGKWVESELSDYRQLRSEGIQPMGTSRKAIDQAKAMSDKYGGAYNAETGLVNDKIPMRSGELV